MDKKKIISIITPCYNEQSSIVECYETIKKIIESELSAYSYEHIFCDNCSTDDTVKILKEIALKDPRIKIIINARNFGILKNTYNGVLSASGDATVLFMPVDLQDPPELIPTFVKHWENGYEIVYGIRGTRQENRLMALARKLYYRILSLLTYVDYPPDVGDYQLVDRKVLDAMKRIDDAQPFMRLMTFDCGFRSIGVRYTWRARKNGKSANRLLHLFDQGLNGIIAFSGAPVRVALVLGLFTSIASLLYAVSILVLALLGKVNSQAGTPTIIIALFFFGGVQMFFLGVLGEYVLAIYNQVRRRPLVIERERINF